jgi:hypothetical protein
MARASHASPHLLVSATRAGEEVGLAPLWFGGHVAYPVEYSTSYPGRRFGRLPFDGGWLAG